MKRYYIKVESNALTDVIVALMADENVCNLIIKRECDGLKVGFDHYISTAVVDNTTAPRYVNISRIEE